MTSQSEGNVQEPDLFALLQPLESPPPPEESPIPPPEEKPDLPVKKQSQPSGLPSSLEKKLGPIVQASPQEAPILQEIASDVGTVPIAQASPQEAPILQEIASDVGAVPISPQEAPIEYPRAHMGIPGLDEMLSGGLIRGSVAAVIGQYGTGKTSFAVHFAIEGLKRGETVLYIALEERRTRLIQYMNSYGVDIQESIKNGKLLVINLDPSDFNLAIQGVKNEIPALIRKTQADRFVIDPISLFEDLFADDATRRRELMRFLETLRDMTNCTFLFTSETDRANPLSSRYNLIEYLSDTVVSLRYVRNTEASAVRLAVEIIKMRMSAHSRETKPYELKPGMVEVYIDANVF